MFSCSVCVGRSSQLGIIFITLQNQLTKSSNSADLLTGIDTHAESERKVQSQHLVHLNSKQFQMQHRIHGKYIQYLRFTIAQNLQLIK